MRVVVMDDQGPLAGGGTGPDGARAPLRVMVVDDHDLFRTGLRRLVEREDDLQVVGEARRGDEAVRRAGELQPDVVVMDVSMPGMTGIEATRAVRAVSPRSAILMLTISDSEQEVFDAVLAGVSGYLLKRSSLAEMIDAIRLVGAGHSTIAPRVTGSLLDRLRRQGQRDGAIADTPQLTARTLDVLELLVAGCDNAEIGRRLHLSPNTIKRHVSGILRQLGVENRIQAAVLAVELGLLDGRRDGAR